jgi:hypothetical protein
MRILVVGAARSATSWVAATLGSTAGAGFLLEPDEFSTSAFGARAAIGQGFVPVLDAADPGPPDLRRLWDAAFGAPVRFVRGQERVASWLFRGVSLDDEWRAMRADHPQVTLRLRVASFLAVPRHLGWAPEHRIVKSVRSNLMLEWLLANWSPTLVVCRRHPLDVLASRYDMHYPVPPVEVERGIRDEGERRFGVAAPSHAGMAHAAWWVGVEMSALEDAIRAHPDFLVVDHEDLCEDAVGRFRALAQELGLQWTEDDEAAVLASNRPGTGYERTRVAAGLPGAWRHRLPPEDARTAAAVLARFPIAERYDLRVD